jgi:hypothetical protein
MAFPRNDTAYKSGVTIASWSLPFSLKAIAHLLEILRSFTTVTLGKCGLLTEYNSKNFDICLLQSGNCMTFISVIFGPNIDRETDYPDSGVSWFFSTPMGNAGIVSQALRASIHIHRNYVYIYMGVCGRVVEWGTTLQAGRLWVRFPIRSRDFSIDLILPAALYSWSRLSL